ncbi:MAG: type 4a pilus biogenesis protein PilO [Phycisphaeraceae bacterium]
MRFGLRELVFLLVLLAMPVAGYFFVFEPRNQQIAEALEEIQRKESKLAQLEAATQSLESLSVEIEKLSNAIEMFEHKLPAQQEVDVILKDVWELASAQDLTPKSVRTHKITATAQYAELPISMEIHGDFNNFYEFLLELEKLPRITRLPSMEMEKVRDKEGAMKANVVLNIFFEGENPQRLQDRLEERRL